MNTKHKVLQTLYDYCKTQGSFVFDNDIVKLISKEKGFGNPFDATKLDDTDKLPPFMKENDICLLHLGKENSLKLYLYTFGEPLQLGSIKEALIKGRRPFNQCFHHFCISFQEQQK